MPKNINKREHAFLMEVNGAEAYEKLKADGNYGLIDPDVKPKNFPIRDISKRTSLFKLFPIDHDMSSKEIFIMMKKDGYQPTVIEELLSLGIKKPELQKEFNIFALGSVHNEYVPALSVDDYNFDNKDVRILGLGVNDTEWLSHPVHKNRFLGVRINFRIFKNKKN